MNLSRRTRTPRRSVALTAALALATLAPAASLAAPPAGRIPTEAVTLSTNVRELYPRREEICLSTYEQMSDATGVVLWLENDVATFSHYRYVIRRDSLPPEAPREARGGSIAVRFDPASPRPQHVVTEIQAVTKRGERTSTYSIEIGFYPGSHFAAAGQRTGGWLVVEDTDLALCGGEVADWIVERPSAEDRAYARKRWGGAVKPYAGDYDRARAIARDLVRALRPHDGIPSDSMRYATPFEQLARAEAGRDRVWCGNYADIFSGACNALDVPVRKVNMQYVWSSRGKTRFEIAEGHRTNEVFDRGRNRWVWMDLTFGIWGAHLGDRELLHTAELVEALNDERRFDRLVLIEYDPATSSETVVPAAKSRHRDDLLKFFRRDQRYQYVRKTAR